MTAFKCCHCNGKGIVAGLRNNESWKKCRDCDGSGWGENGYKVSTLQTLPGGRNFAWVEIIGGSFHARNESEAINHAKWIYGTTAAIHKA